MHICGGVFMQFNNMFENPGLFSRPDVFSLSIGMCAAHIGALSDGLTNSDVTRQYCLTFFTQSVGYTTSIILLSNY